MPTSKPMNIIIGMLLLLMLVQMFVPKEETTQISYSSALSVIQEQDVSTVKLSQNKIVINDKMFAKMPDNGLELSKVITILEDKNVPFDFQRSEPSLIERIILSLLPIFLILGIFLFMMKKQTGGGRGGMMPNTQAFKIIDPSKMTVTFKDVAGIDDIRSDVEEVVDFIQSPEKYFKMGSKLPKGVLLSGEPGTGKTLLAKAMAKEAGCNFIAVSGSDFVEMFVGMGARRVRELFKAARSMRPCIIFIDEIDAVGKKRGGGGTGGNDEREQTLNQLLVEMNGFQDEIGVVVIAATNRPEMLDSALTRPGRFDRQIHVPLPSVDGRLAILKVHSRNKKLSQNVDLSVIARGTVGFSGADLENLMNEASLVSARDNKSSIDQLSIDKAKDKIVMGAESSSNMLSDYEKEMTAYHEAGHAIIGYLSEDHDPVHKVSIIPRGRALGVTVFLPEKDTVSLSKTGILSQIKTLFGGRIAEELVYGADKVSTGASNDIERATVLARKMVTEWGMSSLGTIHVNDKVNQYGEKNTYSESKLERIDGEIISIINNAYEEATKILNENKEELKEMTELLIERETIDSKDIQMIMDKSNVEG
jgi:cell division protease FtsH